MRILQIVASLDLSNGGVAEAVIRTCEQLIAFGHDVTVATLDGSDATLAVPSGATVVPLGPALGRYGYSERFTRWIGDHAGEHDIAILNGLWNYSSIGAWRALRRGRLPYVIYSHGMMDPWFARTYPLKHAAKQLYWWAAEGRVLRDARFVLFTCEEERRLADGVFRGHRYRSRVVAFGTADVPQASDVQRVAFRAAVPELDDERRFILFMGRIHAKKGCDLLVEAFGKLAAAHPALDLVMAGPDQMGLTAQYQALAAKAGIAARIHWPGMLTDDAKWGALHGAEAMALPSHQENFGIVVAEAMACARPVLITDKVNIWREIDAAGAGLVATDTIEGASQMLHNFCGLPDAERARMGDNARLCFTQSFRIDAATRDLLKVLDEAAPRIVGNA